MRVEFLHTGDTPKNKKFSFGGEAQNQENYFPDGFLFFLIEKNEKNKKSHFLFGFSLIQIKDTGEFGKVEEEGFVLYFHTDGNF